MPCKVYSNVLTLVSQLVSTCQTTRRIFRRSPSRRSTALMALRTRLFSWSAACRFRHDLGSTTLCVIVFRCVCWVACPAWQLCRLDHVIIYVRPLCIRVMDDEICMPTLYVVHDWSLGSWMYAYGGFFRLSVWGPYRVGIRAILTLWDLS